MYFSGTQRSVRFWVLALKIEATHDNFMFVGRPWMSPVLLYIVAVEQVHDSTSELPVAHAARQVPVYTYMYIFLTATLVPPESGHIGAGSCRSFLSRM